MKRVTVVFRQEDHMELKLYSVKNGRTMNELIVQAVKLFLQDASKPDNHTQSE